MDSFDCLANGTSSEFSTMNSDAIFYWFTIIFDRAWALMVMSYELAVNSSVSADDSSVAN